VSKETFEKYCEKNNRDYSCQSSWEEKIFTDQQKKIDELTEQGVADVAIREELLDKIDEQAKRIESLREELSRVTRNYSDLYNEKETLTKQRDALREALESVKECHDSICTICDHKIDMVLSQKNEKGE
jgi:predicted nuclease with TOPRIM domain